MRNDWDDEQLLGALREAMRARQAVPSWFVAMGKNAYAWHNIDAELAQLTYDSQADTEQLAFVRSGRRERLFRRGAHPGQPVPASVPYLQRC